MKRLLSVAIVFVILLQCAVFTAYAAGTKRFAYSDVIPGGQGIGFFDTSGSDAMETGSYQSSVIRVNEWYKYSLSGLEPGMYNVYFNGGHPSTMTFEVSVNDEVAIQKAVKPATPGYFNFEEKILGQVYVPDGKSTITIKNIGDQASYWIELYVESVEYSKTLSSYEQQQRPYKSVSTPGIIEGENFDCGIPGIDFFASSESANGGKYRPYAKMNIVEHEDEKGYDLNLQQNEWAKYTFYAPKADDFELIFNTLTIMTDTKLRFYIDNYEVLRYININNRDAYQEFSCGSFHLEEGIHVLTVKCLEGQAYLDYSRFAYSKEKGIAIGEASSMRKWADTLEAEYIEPVDVEEERPVMKELYVTADAKEGGKGTKENPYATLDEAKTAVRNLNKNMTGDIVVHTKGEFFIDEPLTLGVDDSGMNGYKVVWDGGEETVISGGEKVKGFTKVEGTPFYKAKVESEGFRQLYINDNRATRARNKYFMYRKDIYIDPAKSGTRNDACGIVIKGEDMPAPLAAGTGAEIVMKPSWMAVYIPIEEMWKNEDGDYVVTFPQPIFDANSDAVGGYLNIEAFYFENAPELLDEPGEYYFNKATKELFYYPLDFEDLETANVYIPKSQGVLYIEGDDKNFASDITVRGISFMHGGWERPSEIGFSVRQGEEWYDALGEPDEYSSTYLAEHVPGQIQINYSKNINMSNNRFEHLGSVGVHINKESYNVNIYGNVFDDVSAAAVSIGTFKVPKTAPIEDLVHDVKVSNNLIRRAAVEYQSSSGISAYYVNNVEISHNDLYDLPYSGITIGWGWGNNRQNCGDIRVTYNRIIKAIQNLFDGAHIYTLGKMPGTIIANNYMVSARDNRGGVYLDNNTQNVTIKNNVAEDVATLLCATTTEQWSKINNTALNNYCEYPIISDGFDLNNYEQTKGKINGQWPKEAQDIIAHSGLTSQYAHIVEEYDKRENLINASNLLPNPVAKPGIVIYGGDTIEGGEGIGWHEEFGANGLIGKEPPMDGTRGYAVMVTMQGEWTKHWLDIPEDGYYDIIMNASTPRDTTAVTMEIDDEVIADKHLLNNTGHYFTFRETPITTVYLEKGRHTIKAEHAVENYGFKYIRVVPTEIEKQPFDKEDGFNEIYMKEVMGK